MFSSPRVGRFRVRRSIRPRVSRVRVPAVKNAPGTASVGPKVSLRDRRVGSGHDGSPAANPSRDGLGRGDRLDPSRSPWSAWASVDRQRKKRSSRLWQDLLVPLLTGKKRESSMAVRRKKVGTKAATSASLDDFSAELAHDGSGTSLAQRINEITERIDRLGLDPADRELIEIGRAAKKNFAQAFSTAIAQKIADALRPTFPSVQPDQHGGGHESLAAGSSGLKKLDVNCSTSRSGLELAVSVKTVNFRDESTRRYTKNAKRIDGELRAEAQDYHVRQPFAVLAAYVFLPIDAAHDARQGRSSLKHFSEIIAKRSGRSSTGADSSLFEIAFIVLYDTSGSAVVLRPNRDIPGMGIPESTLTFSESLDEVRKIHVDRNSR